MLVPEIGPREYSMISRAILCLIGTLCGHPGIQSENQKDRVQARKPDSSFQPGPGTRDGVGVNPNRRQVVGNDLLPRIFCS